jgi:Arc/MetJ-type ribon-helix-helix transcriptional regulator
MKTMIAFRIEDSTRQLIDVLQKRGNFRSQADLIQSALEALEARLVAIEAGGDSDVLTRLDAIESRLAAIEMGSDSDVLTRLAAIEGQHPPTDKSLLHEWALQLKNHGVSDNVIHAALLTAGFIEVGKNAASSRFMPMLEKWAGAEATTPLTLEEPMK